ncbi:kinase-like domain-containing protein, partial [Gaertneriomyces semiglobifer]
MTDQKTHTHPLLSLTQKTDPSTLFSLLHPIGSGSYGEVWKALATTDSGQIVAMKIIKLEANEDMDDVLNEVLFLSECDHKNVVRYFGCWLKNIKPKRGKEVWIGMEYCGGGSVEGCYKGLKSPLPEPSIRIILFSALHGLRFLHSLNKMHRDIKCGNILLTESGEVKLADFGVSTQLTRTFSKRHTFIGTPYWMAPEVITADQMGEGGGGGGGGGTADIWSLGISALELTDLSPPNFDLHPMRVLFTIPKS